MSVALAIIRDPARLNVCTLRQIYKSLDTSGIEHQVAGDTHLLRQAKVLSRGLVRCRFLGPPEQDVCFI